MSTKHTPGPWDVRKSSNPKNGTAWRDIVSLGGDFGPSYVGEALDVDARLIAAAPDLLAALEEIMGFSPSFIDGRTHYVKITPSAKSIRQARAAIAKATGEDK